MTTGELINLLANYPPDLRVVVDGYEDGFDDLSEGQLAPVKLTLNTGKEEWVGQHGDASHLPQNIPDTAEVVDALVLRRVSR